MYGKDHAEYISTLYGRVWSFIMLSIWAV